MDDSRTGKIQHISEVMDIVLSKLNGKHGRMDNASPKNKKPLDLGRPCEVKMVD